MVAMPSASLFNRCGIGMMLSTVMGEAVFVDLHRGSHFAGLLSLQLPPEAPKGRVEAKSCP